MPKIYFFTIKNIRSVWNICCSAGLLLPASSRGLFIGSFNFIQILLLAQLNECQCPHSLFEDMQIGEEVAGDQNKNNAENAGNKVTDDGRKEIRQQKADAQNNERQEQNDHCINDNAYRDHDHQNDQKHEMFDVADNQLHAFAGRIEDAELLDDKCLRRRS